MTLTRCLALTLSIVGVAGATCGTVAAAPPRAGPPSSAPVSASPGAGSPQPASGAAPSRAGSPPPAPAAQRLVVLGRSQEAYAAPARRSKRVDRVDAVRPITGERTVLPLLGSRTGADGKIWLHVLLPGRPNGHAGWISSAFTTSTTTGWRILVKLSTRRVTVFRDGRVARTFLAVVGKPSTPTPQGRFFVEETVRLDGTRVGSPFALALSARSHVLQEFDGGPGQIALHGTGNIGGVMGTAVSHGCVRLESAAIAWLAGRIGPGVPVVISG